MKPSSMSILLSLTLGCGKPENFEFESHEFENALETLQPILEDLLWPSDMVFDGSGITFIERDTLSIHQVFNNLIEASWEWNAIPLQLLTIDNRSWVRTESGIFSIDGSGITIDEPGITHMFAMNGMLHWVTSGETGQVDNAENTLINVDHPIDTTVVVEDTLFILDRTTKKLHRVSDASASEAHRFDDEPRKLIAEEGTLYATTRSSRWPYGGWIVKLEGSEDSWTETRLSDSPPEAEHILVHDGYVYWSSKQSITRVSTDGGTYEMIAQNTTVGAMLVHDNTLWWTDSKGGRLFALPL